MKKAYLATAIFASLTLAACGGNQTASDTENATSAEQGVVLESENDKQAYALGASMGLFAAARFEEQQALELPVNKEALLAGFTEALNGQERFPRSELQQLTQDGDATLREAQQARAAKAAEENIAAGKAFLAENAEKEGVVVTESGLQYEVLVQGEGASPAATDVVKVHYQGTLLDGTEFDSSYKRGEPIEFALNQVIPGWTEGVQLMQEGSKHKLFIPSELAYGARATGLITPNSTLIFEVELLEVIELPEEETETEE